MKFEIDKRSLERLERKLEKTFPRELQKEGRALVKQAATELRDAIKAAAPEDTGALKRSLYVKLLRDKINAPTAADVRVRTGKKAQKQNREGWYWKFHEYGTTKMEATPFVAPTVERFKARFEQLSKQFKDNAVDKVNQGD